MMYSDDSDEDYNESNFYHRKYRSLLERCEVIQQVILLTLLVFIYLFLVYFH